LSLISCFSSTSLPSVIHTLSLHDALPISSRALAVSSHRHTRVSSRLTRRLSIVTCIFTRCPRLRLWPVVQTLLTLRRGAKQRLEDRKSTRLNSSHVSISYAVFCLKKKR